MFRFYYVVIISIFHEIYYLLRMNHIIRNKEHYSPEHRYAIVRNVVRFIKINGCIFTKSYGTENLPKEGGYIMFPNHQGKYDACGIMYTHKKRCSFVIDKKKANMPILKQILALSDSLPMEIDNVRQSIGVIKEVADRVKNGERFFIFPEGGYKNNRNNLQDFKAGCFKSALMAKCPIVPVVLVDSWKVFNYIGLGHVRTKVFYLPAIPYEEYKDMKTHEIADMVKVRIEEVLCNYR